MNKNKRKKFVYQTFIENVFWSTLSGSDTEPLEFRLNVSRRLPKLVQMCLYRNSVYSSHVKILRSQGPLRLQPFSHCRCGKTKLQVLLKYYESPFHDLNPQKYKAQKSIWYWSSAPLVSSLVWSSDFAALFKFCICAHEGGTRPLYASLTVSAERRL